MLNDCFLSMTYWCRVRSKENCNAKQPVWTKIIGNRRPRAGKIWHMIRLKNPESTWTRGSAALLVITVSQKIRKWDMEARRALLLWKGATSRNEMVYISTGLLLDSLSQSPWRLSLITDFFWGIAELVALFFKTLLQQDVKKGRSCRNSSDSR